MATTTTITTSTTTKTTTTTTTTTSAALATCPPEVWVRISKLLRPEDFLGLSIVARRLLEETEQQAVWRQFCHSHGFAWGVEEKDEADSTRPFSPNIAELHGPGTLRWCHLFKVNAITERLCAHAGIRALFAHVRLGSTELRVPLPLGLSGGDSSLSQEHQWLSAHGWHHPSVLAQALSQLLSDSPFPFRLRESAAGRPGALIKRAHFVDGFTAASAVVEWPLGHAVDGRWLFLLPPYEETHVGPGRFIATRSAVEDAMSQGRHSNNSNSSCKSSSSSHSSNNSSEQEQQQQEAAGSTLLPGPHPWSRSRGWIVKVVVDEAWDWDLHTGTARSSTCPPSSPRLQRSNGATDPATMRWLHIGASLPAEQVTLKSLCEDLSASLPSLGWPSSKSTQVLPASTRKTGYPMERIDMTWKLFEDLRWTQGETLHLQCHSNSETPAAAVVLFSRDALRPPRKLWRSDSRHRRPSLAHDDFAVDVSLQTGSSSTPPPQQQQQRQQQHQQQHQPQQQRRRLQQQSCLGLALGALQAAEGKRRLLAKDRGWRPLTTSWPDKRGPAGGHPKETHTRSKLPSAAAIPTSVSASAFARRDQQQNHHHQHQDRLSVAAATTLQNRDTARSFRSVRRRQRRLRGTSDSSLEDSNPRILSSTRGVRQFEFHPSRPGTLLAGCKNGRCIVVDYEADAQTHSVGIDVHPILGLSWFHTQPQWAVAGSSHSGTISLIRYDENNPGPVEHVRFEAFPNLSSLSMCCTDDFFMTSGFCLDTSLYDVVTGRRMSTFRGLHRNFINIQRFSNTSPHIFATASFDRTCKIWDLREPLVPQRPAQDFTTDTLNVMCAFSPDDRHILCSGVDSMLKQFPLRSASAGPSMDSGTSFPLPSLNSSTNYRRSQYLADGSLVVTGATHENCVRLFSAEDPHQHVGSIDFHGCLRQMKLQECGSGVGACEEYVQSLRCHPSDPSTLGVLLATVEPCSDYVLCTAKLPHLRL